MVKRLLAVLFFALPAAAANQLTVDARTLRMNDMATVTVSLEGEFAEAEAVNPPLQNLDFVGEPWVSTEFAWINGVVSRRKVFRFRIRPLAPGKAQVGPLLVMADDGARQTLPAIALDIAADRALGSNDPESLMRDLRASARDPVFVISEVDKSSVVAGEAVRITWYLYNAVSVQQWQIVGVPKLDDFWTEEVPVRNEPAERVFVGNDLVQRLPIRRVVLYPLRSGTLNVGGITVEAAVMRRYRTGVFAGFEGELVETSFTSAPIVINAKPLPGGAPIDVVGEFSLQCQPARQSNAGPVVMKVTLAGEGNVRGAPPPRFGERVAGDVQIEGGEVTSSREEGSVAMSREWRYLIFPSREGLLYIPPLTLNSFVPLTEQRKELRCEAQTLEALASATPVGPESEERDAPRNARRRWPWLGGGAAALLAVLLVLPRVRRTLELRRDVRELVGGKSPAEIRAAVDARVDPRLMHEASDRGDAYRALRSLLDAAERERDIAVDAEEEIERRLRELLRIAAFTDRNRDRAPSPR